MLNVKQVRGFSRVKLIKTIQVVTNYYYFFCLNIKFKTTFGSLKLKWKQKSEISFSSKWIAVFLFLFICFYSLKWITNWTYEENEKCIWNSQVGSMSTRVLRHLFAWCVFSGGIVHKFNILWEKKTNKMTRWFGFPAHFATYTTMYSFFF